jgi:hypothetical protein
MRIVAILIALTTLSIQAVAAEQAPVSEPREFTYAGVTFEIRTLPPGTQRVRETPPPPSPHIRALEADRFEIDRVLVNKYAYNLGALMKLAWVYPHKDESGRTDGYRLGGIRPGNILYQGGLRSGDVLMSVNGRATRNMAQVVLAHSQLRFRNDFEVVVMRRDNPLILNYTLVR